MRYWLPCSLCLLLAASPVRADDARTAELERKVDALSQEIENLKLGAAAVPDTARTVARFGFAPAASKVYGERRGISIGGYGEMLYEHFDHDREDGVAAGRTDRIDFLRQVFYIGYKFSDELLFNSEVEFEHAGVKDEAEVEVDPLSGRGDAELSGEAGLEFAYLEWSRHRAFGVRAGMVLLPLGLTNELHEPPIFFTARRPDVEQIIIPTTWRGNGAGVFGELANGLSYRAYLTEGLDASHFNVSEGIREGRQNGSQSAASRAAVSARLDWSGMGLVIGGSGYSGGAVQAGSAGSSSTRVSLVDAHARLQWRAFEGRALYAQGTLADPAKLSDALGLTGVDRLGEHFFGGYLEGACDLLAAFQPGSRYALNAYGRYEEWDTQEGVDAPGIEDPAHHHTALTLGASFKPHPNVVVKADHQHRHNEADTETSQWNAALGYLF